LLFVIGVVDVVGDLGYFGCWLLLCLLC